MPREETDREDLLRDATAMVERLELSLGDTGSASAAVAAAIEHVVTGFRVGGAVSFFFGADHVYQFNAAGELRRAYCDGLLVKASRGRLVSLNRKSQTGRGGRQQNEVQLLTHEMSDAEQDSFIARMCDRLQEITAALKLGRYSIVGQVPADADVLGRVRQWLATHDGRSIANSPRVEA